MSEDKKTKDSTSDSKAVLDQAVIALEKHLQSIDKKLEDILQEVKVSNVTKNTSSLSLKHSEVNNTVIAGGMAVLNELASINHISPPHCDDVYAGGPPHAPVYRSTVKMDSWTNMIGEKVPAIEQEGFGSSKKESRHKAADLILAKLKDIKGIKFP